ncbi:MAG: 23S rRNA (guanosine(2251)-2'-O)-methyltransferase RlmB [Deltaproteobacteria bacterium]|nr:MAG: 23S rRNA (guanosine(2251)-2'-O)-methyltransferase RlmB [Deltaproteobacteria bacterium]
MTYAIPGFHAIREALTHAHSPIREVWLAQEKRSARIREILVMAKERNIPVHFVRVTELKKHFPGMVHQGMVAVSDRFSYCSLTEIAQKAGRSPGSGLILAADHITDEGNLGALVRAGAFFGADGLVIPKDRSAQVGSAVIKRSSGAAGILPICRVVNLRRALDSLGEKGFWIIGAAGESPLSIYSFDWKRALVLVLGNEERGLSRSVRKGCHEVVSIPRCGSMESLNISMAAGVILGEIRRQQNQEGSP